LKDLSGRAWPSASADAPVLVLDDIIDIDAIPDAPGQLTHAEVKAMLIAAVNDIIERETRLAVMMTTGRLD
jgi:hypothetical protein